MIREIFSTTIYIPLYNALIYFIDIVPGFDVGLAVILLTLVIKVVLFPLSLRVAKTQEITRRIAPQIDALKKKHKGDRQAEAQALLALYREHDIHPFSSILNLLVQLPILFGLYFVFARGGLPVVDVNLLYSFVPRPESVDMVFFGVDMATHGTWHGLLNGTSLGNALLALIAGVSQFVYAKLATPPPPQSDGTLQADMQRSLALQMRYVLPLIISVFSYTLTAAVPLYWTTSNLFMIGQEYYVRLRIRNKTV